MQLADRLEELIEQPGAENFYWALSALPRPLVSLRKAMEQEQRLAETQKRAEADQAMRVRSYEAAKTSEAVRSELEKAEETEKAPPLAGIQARARPANV